MKTYLAAKGWASMDFDDERDDEPLDDAEETGSDELLSDDNLRLPEDANALVRLHAVRAWFKRRQREIKLTMGETALDLQASQHSDDGAPLRRRAYQEQMERAQRLQSSFQQDQERLDAYVEAEAWLEDCVDHTTIGERLLVEYYLQLETEVQTDLQEHEQEETPRIKALLEILQRVERVAATYEQD
jgi:hypothetical protein